MKGIITFILIAFGLAWLPWEIALVFGPDPGIKVIWPIGLLAGLSPAIAAFVVRMWITREGFADAGLKPNLTRWRYYLVGWLLPGLVVIVIVVLSIALGISDPYFTIGHLPNFALQLTIAALIGTFWVLGAEFAWRGYLQLRLFAHQPLLAAVATGIIWSLWHHVPNEPLKLRLPGPTDTRNAGHHHHVHIALDHLRLATRENRKHLGTEPSPCHGQHGRRDLHLRAFWRTLGRPKLDLRKLRRHPSVVPPRNPIRMDSHDRPTQRRNFHQPHIVSNNRFRWGLSPNPIASVEVSRPRHCSDGHLLSVVTQFGVTRFRAELNTCPTSAANERFMQHASVHFVATGKV